MRLILETSMVSIFSVNIYDEYISSYLYDEYISSYLYDEHIYISSSESLY